MRVHATAQATALLRAMRGETPQTQMAHLLGVAQNTVSAVETGAQGRTPETLEHYLEVYAGVMLGRLLAAGDEWRFVAAQVCAVARVEPRDWSGPWEAVQAVMERAREALGVGDV